MKVMSYDGKQCFNTDRLYIVNRNGKFVVMANVPMGFPVEVSQEFDEESEAIGELAGLAAEF